MNNLLSLALGAAVLFVACADKKEDLIQDDGIGACLMAKNYKYEELLTKSDIAKHVTIDEGTYKVDVSPTRGEYGSCSYEWHSNRPDIPMELLGQVISVPDKNRVMLKMLGFYTDGELKLYSQASAIDLFDQSYKKLSQQEYEELLANLAKEYANDQAGFKQAKGFLDARMEFTFEPVANVGNRAYWSWDDEHGIKLVVLAGAAYFTIESKTTGNATTSLEHAVHFAKEVLAKCAG